MSSEALNGGTGLDNVSAEEVELFEKYLAEWKGATKSASKAVESDGGVTKESGHIPPFYFRVPTDDELLRQKLREEARATFLQRRSRNLVDHDELKELWILLDRYSQGSSTSDRRKINYRDFKAVAETYKAKCKSYFKPSLFAQLIEGDPSGQVPIISVFNYVMRKVWLQQTRISLSLYDATGQGYLTERDMEYYILDLIPTLPQLGGLEPSFHNFYACTAVRKFFFFLDPMRSGRVRIQDVLSCSFLDDLLELRDEELPKEAQESNWFSAPSALKVYGQYLNLDKDHNGMLSKKELQRYGTGVLTSVFIERLFEECLTYDGEMDYKTYLDFVLALENRKEPQSLQYFFKILDVENQGYLTTFSLSYFFRAIQDQLKSFDQEPVSFNDIKDELYDMIKPEKPDRITLKDLCRSGQGDVLVSVLIDLNGFWTHENRELMDSDAVEQTSEESQKSPPTNERSAESP